MAGLRPGAIPPQAERCVGPVVAGIGILTLAVCTIVAADQPHGRWPVTLILAGAAGLWLFALIPAVRYRTRKPWLAAGFFAVLLACATALVAQADPFTVFASIGYPIAFVLFAPRWSVFAAAATAVVPLLGKGAWQPDTSTPPWITVISIAGPILYVAWFVGAENEQRRRTNEKLAEANERLETALTENAVLQAQLLSQARHAGVLDERRRMAREFHDTVAQGLTGIVTQLQAADRATEDAERQRRLGQVHTLARESLTEARRAVLALRPEPLVESHLPEALSGLASRVSGTSGVKVTAETEGDARPLPPELEVTLYRVAQEALANAEKHAHADRIGLTLTYAGDLVLLDIRDDGTGFVLEDCGGDRESGTGAAAHRGGTRSGPAHSSGDRDDGTGFGLQAMRQRVRQAAGTLTIESAPGEGTAVHAEFPAIPSPGTAPPLPAPSG
ncbi:sensor histidine kinase [Amycolatopsis benzoatilytica]|uniref:sensor histidine kinase n=1 Tax=Amycolatopsis benzoatilytica TaxID=346045 RepID=UPI0003774F8D|nr:sensor histidine kinase [Amycolatopsis benzoatilytica]